MTLFSSPFHSLVEGVKTQPEFATCIPRWWGQAWREVPRLPQRFIVPFLGGSTGNLLLRAATRSKAGRRPRLLFLCGGSPVTRYPRGGERRRDGSPTTRRPTGTSSWAGQQEAAGARETVPAPRPAVAGSSPAPGGGGGQAAASPRPEAGQAVNDGAGRCRGRGGGRGAAGWLQVGRGRRRDPVRGGEACGVGGRGREFARGRPPRVKEGCRAARGQLRFPRRGRLPSCRGR